MPQGSRRRRRREFRGVAREPRLNELALRTENPRTVLHDVSLSLARNADISAFAQALVERAPCGNRLARLTAVFTFVANLVDPKAPDDGVRDGVDWLLALAGEAEGPAVILSALLLALGERAAVEYHAGTTFVRVELDAADVARLPPHARPYTRAGRLFIPLDARRARAPFAFVPDRWVRPLLLR